MGDALGSFGLRNHLMVKEVARSKKTEGGKIIYFYTLRDS